MKPRKIMAMILAIVMATALLAGCGGSGSSTSPAPAQSPDVSGEAPVVPSVLNIALAGQPEHLDVALSTMDIASEVVYGSVFEKLTAFTADNTVIPELAESWEITNENRVYTYHLRQGVMFHNGQEMTAEDVAQAIPCRLTSDSASPLLLTPMHVQTSRPSSRGKYSPL